MRIASEMQFAALSNGLQVDVASEFAIEGQVPDVDVRIDGRCVWRAGALEDEVGASFDGETIGMELPDAGEVEIITNEVEIKGAGRRIVGGASGDD